MISQTTHHTHRSHPSIKPPSTPSTPQPNNYKAHTIPRSSWILPSPCPQARAANFRCAASLASVRINIFISMWGLVRLDIHPFSYIYRRLRRNFKHHHHTCVHHIPCHSIRDFVDTLRACVCGVMCGRCIGDDSNLLELPISPLDIPTSARPGIVLTSLMYAQLRPSPYGQAARQRPNYLK